MRTTIRFIACTLVLATAATLPTTAWAGCGCDKPPPARAVIRPFVAHAGQTVTLFDDGLMPGHEYRVEFRTPDGASDWSAGRGRWLRDLADREKRAALEVAVPPVSLGPVAVTVWDGDQVVLDLADAEFTVAAQPVELHEYQETIVEDGYRAAVGRDGTLYIPIGVGAVSEATTFVARGIGYPLRYGADDVAIYNEQGFLMQVLDPSATGLFEIRTGAGATSDSLEYWRHEFETYRRAHRRDATRGRGDGPDWHADGTPHVDHDHLVVAIRGTLPGERVPAAGATPPFSLELASEPAPR